jgi:hypothetical protein
MSPIASSYVKNLPAVINDEEALFLGADAPNILAASVCPDCRILESLFFSLLLAEVSSSDSGLIELANLVALSLPVIFSIILPPISKPPGLVRILLMIASVNDYITATVLTSKSF